MVYEKPSHLIYAVSAKRSRRTQCRDRFAFTVLKEYEQL